MRPWLAVSQAIIVQYALVIPFNMTEAWIPIFALDTQQSSFNKESKFSFLALFENEQLAFVHLICAVTMVFARRLL